MIIKLNIKDKQKDGYNIYTCGPTLYSKPHIGNFRPLFASSVIVNILRHYDIKVRFISNITDIGHESEYSLEGEDKILAACKGKLNYYNLVQIYYKDYINDLKKIIQNIPEIYSASNFLDHSGDHIQNINSQCYEKDGSIYYDTKNIDKSKLIKGGKRINDFVVKRFKGKDILKHKFFNDSIPGWHVECFSIIDSIFTRNKQILDIHIGGIDLADIHHNCEIMHHFAEYGNYDFSKNWLHVNSVNYNGVKMSKSKNNVLYLNDPVIKYSAVLNIIFAKSDFQSLIDINESVIGEATKILENIVTKYLQYICKEKNFSNFSEIYDFFKYNKHIEYKKDFNIMPESNSDVEINLSALYNNIVNNKEIKSVVNGLLIFDINIHKVVHKVLKKTMLYQYLIDKRSLLKKQKNYDMADLIKTDLLKYGEVIDISNILSIIF